MNAIVNSIVIYKNNAALVTEANASGKYSIKFRTAEKTATKPAQYGTQNVRAKDFVVLHESGIKLLEKVLDFADSKAPDAKDMYNLEQENELFLQVRDAYELLVSDEETASAAISLEDLVSLMRGELTAEESWGIFLSLRNTPYFVLDAKEFSEGNIVFVPRPMEEIDSLVKKAAEKGHEEEFRAAFIQRLKDNALNLPDDGKYMVEVEAFALGRSDKSKVMHDAHLKETPERAHKLLIDTGIWDITRNPYPHRWGLSVQSAKEMLPPPPEEERVRIDGISYAIDNAWSDDPDDAVAWDGEYLWVHIADPASAVMPDSVIDKSARGRGVTLYLPEGAARMLCESSLADYALGLSSLSRALSFRLRLDENGNVEDCAVMKTVVEVRRLTYEKASELCDSPELKPLFDIAEKNIQRRNASGAVQISMPEVHIKIDPDTKKVSIEPEVHPSASVMVREMMLLAGEGAAKFAFKNNIPFPYVSQEAPTLPEKIPEGLAGQYALRRCMHRRSVGVTPSMHCGLGINMYSQVTSPLRRYGDLIAHMQLRAFLDGRPVINKDDMLMRVSEGDAASQASRKAERKTRMHWTLVYLIQNPDWVGEAVCLDNSGKQPMFSIPSLGQETFIAVNKVMELNETIRVRASNINICDQTVDFIQTE